MESYSRSRCLTTLYISTSHTAQIRVLTNTSTHTHTLSSRAVRLDGQPSKVSAWTLSFRVQCGSRCSRLVVGANLRPLALTLCRRLLPQSGCLQAGGQTVTVSTRSPSQTHSHKRGNTVPGVCFCLRRPLGSADVGLTVCANMSACPLW